MTPSQDATLSNASGAHLPTPLNGTYTIRGGR